MALCWSYGMIQIKILCFRWLFTLCGYISISMVSLMSQSIYPVLVERSSVSCSLIIWSWLMLCSTTANLSVCASCICLLCFFTLIWIYQLLCPINTLLHSHAMLYTPSILNPKASLTAGWWL